MKLSIDEEARTLEVQTDGASRTLALYSKESFELLSRVWLKVGWNERYPYTFSWLGRPVIQLPEDLLRAQEVIHAVRPDLIIETGIAHGGSLVFYASLCKALGSGRVLGIDVELRPHNRAAIESHPLFPYITLIEGDSVAPETVQRVHAQVRPGERVLVFLDSKHSRAHVRAELEAYAGLVAPGSYIVATDGSMGDLVDVPRGQPAWSDDNPAQAARDFLQTHPEFVLEQPAWPFNESELSAAITHWPDAWLRRR